MNTKKKVRLSDIAQQLNISTVTVSKALSNKEGVGEDLRKEIKKVANQMGYRLKKNNQLSANKITGNIGILIPSRFFSQSISFYWYLFNFISTELLHRNYYSIMELLSDADEENLMLPRILNDKKVDGIIILGQISSKYLETINSHYDNFILLDFYTNRTNIDCVSNDDYYCSYILTSYVINQGHKKLRFVGNFEATTSIRDRFMGFQKALLENGLSTSKDEIIADRDSKGMNVTIDIPEDDMPTAFICNCDETAVNLIHELTQKGYRIPEDISITGFDNYIEQQRANSIDCKLTTVYVKPEDTASIAADLIIKKITGQPYVKGRHVVGGQIIIRDSVKSLK